MYNDMYYNLSNLLFPSQYNVFGRQGRPHSQGGEQFIDLLFYRNKWCMKKLFMGKIQ